MLQRRLLHAKHIRKETPFRSRQVSPTFGTLAVQRRCLLHSFRRLRQPLIQHPLYIQLLHHLKRAIRIRLEEPVTLWTVRHVVHHQRQHPLIQITRTLKQLRGVKRPAIRIRLVHFTQHPPTHPFGRRDCISLFLPLQARQNVIHSRRLLRNACLQRLVRSVNIRTPFLHRLCVSCSRSRSRVAPRLASEPRPDHTQRLNRSKR